LRRVSRILGILILIVSTVGVTISIMAWTDVITSAAAPSTPSFVIENHQYKQVWIWAIHADALETITSTIEAGGMSAASISIGAALRYIDRRVEVDIEISEVDHDR
jgi:hypothetical protein